MFFNFLAPHLIGHILSVTVLLQSCLFSSSGRNQVLVGVIPANTVHWSNHSSKSFFPLAIANCKEER